MMIALGAGIAALAGIGAGVGIGIATGKAVDYPIRICAHPPTASITS